jgi:hypothetical protein
MLYLLGIGSNIAMMSCLMTVVRDRFKKVKNWHAALVIAILGTLCGSVYMTPVSFNEKCDLIYQNIFQGMNFMKYFLKIIFYKFL